MIQAGEHIDALWAKLCEDSRHSCVVKLAREDNLISRSFGGWSIYRASRQELREIVRQAEAAYEKAQSHPWLGAVRALSFMLDQERSPSESRASNI